MKSFKLKDKNEEEKILEQQKIETDSAKHNESLNITQKNVQTTKALIMGIIAILIMLVPKGGFVSIILVIFAARRLLRAKKIGENKKYMNIVYVIIYLPVLIWIASSVIFALSMTQ